MKKIMLFAAACAVLAACNKNIDTTTPATGDASSFEKGQKVTLTVKTGDQTKVSSELVTSGTDKDKVNFKWETGDKIKVTVGTESAEFTLKTGAGTNTATFEGTMPAAGNNFDVQYPTTDPSLIEQTYIAGSLPKDKMKMTATGCTIGTSFTLTPQYATLRLNLYGSKTVGKIVVIKIDSTDPSYTLDCGTGAAIGATSEAATPFFIVVPAGNFKFSAEILDNASTPASICKFKTTTAKTFTAGQILNMPAKEVKVPVIEFSVSATKKVSFAPSNLYWDGSNWHFEENPYTKVITRSATHVAHFYYASTAELSYGNNPPTETQHSCFFAEGNGGITVDGNGGYYLPSQAEWYHLFNTRTNSAGLQKVNVTVNGNDRCTIIAPDGWEGTIASSYTLEEWTAAQAEGLVCLTPNGRGWKYGEATNTNCGEYLTATEKSDTYVYRLYWYSTATKVSASEGYARDENYSVRLVKNIN